MSKPLPVFRVDETHGRAVRAGNRLIANSQDAGWRSLHAAILEEGLREVRSGQKRIPPCSEPNGGSKFTQ